MKALKRESTWTFYTGNRVSKKNNKTGSTGSSRTHGVQAEFLTWKYNGRAEVLTEKYCRVSNLKSFPGKK